MFPREMGAVFPCLLVVAAGCIGAAPAPEGVSSLTLPAEPSPVRTARPLDSLPLEQEATLRFSDETGYTVQIDGSGWGRLELLAESAVDIEIELSHESMEDLGVFSDEGEGIYDEKNYTAIYMFPEEEAPRAEDSYWFVWWGTPDWAIWPSVSTDVPWGGDSVRLAPNETAVLLVANTVPGFTITLRDGSGGAGYALPYKWTLGPSPGLQLFLPEMQETALVNEEVARVERQRLWESDASLDEPAHIMVQAWSYTTGVNARAGIGSDILGSQAQSGPPPDPLFYTGPIYHVAAGGGSLSALRGSTNADEPVDLRFFRDQRHTTVGVENIEDGAAFLTIQYVSSAG